MTVLKEKSAKIYARAQDDWYVEPIGATTALLSVETFDGRVHDPACGQGNVVAAFLRHGHQLVSGSDKVLRPGAAGAAWFMGRHDFLAKPWTWREPVHFVFNPPYGAGLLAIAFIKAAVALKLGKVCAFVDVRFLFSEERATGFFREMPPSRGYYVTPRCSCPPGDFLLAGGSATGGQADFVWLVWDPEAPAVSMPAMGWCIRPKEPRRNKGKRRGSA